MKKWQKSGTFVVSLGIMFGLAGGLFSYTGVVATAETTTNQEVTRKTVSIQILGINDFHGALDTTGSFYNDEGKKTEKAGTAALLAGYLNQAEKDFTTKHSNGQTLRVHSGDMVGASPASSALLQDEPIIKALNQMNFSVGTLGNHEFDKGLAEFNRIMTGGKPSVELDKYGILADYPREASKAEIVIGNVVKKGTADHPEFPYNWKPYTIKEVGENDSKVKIGFIGVLTTEVPNLVLKEHYEAYDFLDEAQTIAYYAEQLRLQGVHAIVVLAHIPATSKGEVVSGDAADILNKVNTIDPNNSVDALFAGHNHQYTNGVVNKTRVVQSTSQGKGFVDLQGEIDVETQEFVDIPKAEVRAVDPAAANAPEKDKVVEAIVKDAQKRVEPVTNKKIGTAKEAGNITRELNEFKESALGNLITDAQVAMANAQGSQVDFAMTNNGGVRADLAVGDNQEITWGAAQAVQPFGNIMQIVEMTGAQVEQVLNEQYTQKELYNLQISGLTYTYVKNENETQPFVVKDIYKKDGTLVESNQVYRVVINDFLLGDGFSGFTGSKVVDTMQSDTDTFIGYIEAKEAIGEPITASVEGRKKLVDAKEETPQPDETALAKEKIRKATIFDPLYEDDDLLRGVTLPNAKVILFPEEVSFAILEGQEDIPEAKIVANADGEGFIRINVQPLKLQGKKKITALVVDETANKVAFSIDVLPAKVLNETITSSTTVGTGNTSGKELPQTGAHEEGLALVGFAIVGSLSVFEVRRKVKVK